MIIAHSSARRVTPRCFYSASLSPLSLSVSLSNASQSIASRVELRCGGHAGRGQLVSVRVGVEDHNQFNREKGCCAHIAEAARLLFLLPSRFRRICVWVLEYAFSLAYMLEFCSLTFGHELSAFLRVSITSQVVPVHSAVSSDESRADRIVFGRYNNVGCIVSYMIEPSCIFALDDRCSREETNQITQPSPHTHRQPRIMERWFP